MTVPIGTLMKKIHSQPNDEVIRPPRTTPSAAPRPLSAPHTAITRVRAAPADEAMARDSAAGDRQAAPIPCSARPASSTA